MRLLISSSRADGLDAKSKMEFRIRERSVFDGRQ